MSTAATPSPRSLEGSLVEAGQRHAPARHTEDFNAAWGPTMPAELTNPVPFQTPAVHSWAPTMPAALEPDEPSRSAPTDGWAATMPAALEEAISAQPDRQAMDGGLALREVDEPDLFRHFFGDQPKLTIR